MNDTIYRQQAIDEVINLWADKPFGNPTLVEIKDCIETLPSAQPEILACGSGELVQESDGLVHNLVKDCISRKQAIDAMRKLQKWNVMREDYKNVGFSYDDVMFTLEKLTSAQPEIIRCTECKHYREYDSKYVENAVVVQCMADRYPISEIIPDGWFCAGAERKDDE